MHFVHKTAKLGTIFPAYKNLSPKSGHIVPRGSLCSRCSTNPFLGTANPREGKLALFKLLCILCIKRGNLGQYFRPTKTYLQNLAILCRGAPCVLGAPPILFLGERNLAWENSHWFRLLCILCIKQGNLGPYFRPTKTYLQNLAILCCGAPCVFDAPPILFLG